MAAAAPPALVAGRDEVSAAGEVEPAAAGRDEVAAGGEVEAAASRDEDAAEGEVEAAATGRDGVTAAGRDEVPAAREVEAPPLGRRGRRSNGGVHHGAASHSPTQRGPLGLGGVACLGATSKRLNLQIESGGNRRRKTEIWDGSWSNRSRWPQAWEGLGEKTRRVREGRMPTVGSRRDRR